MIRYAFCQADKIIAVSQPLKEKIIALGIPAEKVVLIPNGVDTQVFRSLDKKECRAKLSLPLDKRLVVFVGNLEKIKGIDVLVEATAKTDEQTDLYLKLLKLIENKLSDNAWIIAHDIYDKDQMHDFDEYLEYVRNSENFKQSISLDVDSCGMELTIKGAK